MKNYNFLNISSIVESIPDFSSPNYFLEQYITPISIIKDYFDLYPVSNSEIILDLGVGTGKLSCLASEMGSKNIIGVDVDRSALRVAKKLKINNLTLIHSSIEFFPISKMKSKVNGVIMNPPFGTKRKFLDFVFLKKAMKTGGWILSLHKNNKDSIDKIMILCQNNNYSISNQINSVLHLPKTYELHNKDSFSINVSLLFMVPNF